MTTRPPPRPKGMLVCLSHRFLGCALVSVLVFVQMYTNGCVLLGNCLIEFTGLLVLAC